MDLLLPPDNGSGGEWALVVLEQLGWYCGTVCEVGQ